jgi:hypothetical protein
MGFPNENKYTYNNLGWILFSIATIIIIWSIIIMPSFMNAQWGHADDGVDILLAKKGLPAAFNFHLGRMFFGFNAHNWFLYKIGDIDHLVFRPVN